MAENFRRLVFTPAVLAAQQHAFGASQPVDTTREPEPDAIGEAERAFIEARDSFYLATVTESGWPYVQHRGGPVGFLRVVDSHTIGFADMRGNRQLITTGNLSQDGRVALILMDYPNQQRLKILGRARLVDATAAEAAAGGFAADDRVERICLIQVEGLDWNCPKHITPRYSGDRAERRV